MHLVFLGVLLTREIMDGCGPTLKEFKAKVEEDVEVKQKIAAIKSEVEAFALSFPLPGLEEM